MRRDLVAALACPECGGAPLDLWTSETAGDDVVHGALVHQGCGHAFPIAEGVASLLALADADTRHWATYLSRLRPGAPAHVAPCIDRTLARLQALHDTSTGKWNREEMEYYDAQVDSPEQRARAVESMRTFPLWHIFLERERHLLGQLGPTLKGRVLEIGAGNGRTIFWLRRPAMDGYRYVGTDISFKRLVLGRSAMPEGDFIQCSALNLPFLPSSFDVVIAFGMMHHLPDVPRGLSEAGERVAAGGFFLLHEPILRPKLLPDGRFVWLRRLFQTYEHSEHDHEIELPGTLQALDRLGLEVRHLHYSGSLPRSVLARLLAVHKRLLGSRWAWERLLALDKAFIRLACPTPNRLGPKAVFVVARRPGDARTAAH